MSKPSSSGIGAKESAGSKTGKKNLLLAKKELTSNVDTKKSKQASEVSGSELGETLN